MPNPFIDLLFGNGASGGLLEVITPRRTFDDVILPEETRRALDHALVQIEKHDLLYREWGLAERHSAGLGLAFNFAGPPGTGKTICAEAVAHELGRKLLVARYAELESMWVGNTGKNVEAVFRRAERENAVLFFDEADAIAGQRFTGMDQGYQREANAVINIMLRELEEFSGVVIFATNLAANLDPAFERRIRTHVLFERPDADRREQIWKVQLHREKTPLAEDVDFGELARQYEATGGEIKNAVLKAAQMAVAEPGPDRKKQIHQHHFERGIREVLEAKNVMGQSLFDENGLPGSPGGGGFIQALVSRQDALADDIEALDERVSGPVSNAVQSVEEAVDRQADTLTRIRSALERQQILSAVALVVAVAALLISAVVLVVAL